MMMKFMQITVLMIMGLLFGVQYVDAGTVTLTGTNQVEDVFLRGDDGAGGTTPVNNYGGNDFIMVGRLADGASNTNLANTLLRFSGFSSLSNQVVQSAILRVWNQNHVNQTADAPINVYEVALANGDWVEGNGLGAVITGTSDWRFKIQNTGDWAGGRNGCGVAGTDYINSLVGSAVATNTTQEWVNFTLDVDVIQNWIDNPDQNNGFVLTAPGAVPGEVAYFYSSEKGGNAMPQLVLETAPRTTENFSFSGTNQVKDVYLRGDNTEVSATANYGGSSVLVAGRLSETVVNNSLLRFTDLSGLSGRTVSNATLRLYNYNHANQTAGVTVDVYEVASANGDWVEGDYLGGTGWDASDWRFKVQNTGEWAGGRNGCGVAGTDYTSNLVGSALFADTTAEWVDVELDASVVQNWINNPGQNYGLILTAPNATNSGELIYLESSEASSGNGPELMIEVLLENSFETWAGAQGLSGDDAAADADPDEDGMENLLEYALGGNPVSNDVVSILPAFSMVDGSGTNWLEYVYNRRRDAEARGLDYDMILTEDLIAGSWTNIGQSAETGSASIDDDFEIVTNRIAVDVSVKFATLEVTED